MYASCKAYKVKERRDMALKKPKSTKKSWKRNI